LLEISNLTYNEKVEETENNKKIFDISKKVVDKEATEEDEVELATCISLQKTKKELLNAGTEIEEHKALVFIIYKVGRATKKYQLEKKVLSDNKIEELSENMNVEREKETPEEETIRELEELIDNIMKQTWETEREKLKTFRMLHDERPSNHMIELEKNIGGYTSIHRINQPNPNYISPEDGGMEDDVRNPKKRLLTDPAEVRMEMRYEEIHAINIQETRICDTWRRNVMAFLRGNNVGFDRYPV
jgi:hypothetical protein